MISTTHPDATAFVARFLANPDDRLGRLVFADWLDERGDDSSVAWAEYIRTQAELESLEWSDPALVGLYEQSATAARHIRAKLTMPAPWPEKMTAHLRLLPANRYSLRFDDYWDDPSGRDRLPRSIADEYLLLPLCGDEKDLFLASYQPINEMLHRRLTFILNANVHLFGAVRPITSENIEWTYTCTGPLWGPLELEWTVPPIEPAGVSALDAILGGVIAAGVQDVLISGTHRGGVVVYRTAGGWRNGPRLTLDELRLILGGVRGKLSGAPLPLFPQRLEFVHSLAGQTYFARGHLRDSRPGPRLWFSLTPQGDGTGVAR